MYTSIRLREGVKTHGLAGCAVKVKVPHLGNVAIADTMLPGFSRASAGYGANSMTRLSYLRRWPKDGVKTSGVTIPNPHRPPRSPRPPPGTRLDQWGNGTKSKAGHREDTCTNSCTT